MGLLKPGRRVDFAVFDVDDYREIPYFFGVEHTAAVYIGGRAAFVPRHVFPEATEKAENA